MYAAVAHMLCDDTAIDRLQQSPIRKALTTDTIENRAAASSRKVQVVSAAPLLAEAIRRIHQRESISVLFTQ